MKELFQCRLYHDGGGRDDQELGLLRFYDNSMCHDSGIHWVRWDVRNGVVRVEGWPIQSHDMTRAVEEIQDSYDEYVAAAVNRLMMSEP